MAIPTTFLTADETLKYVVDNLGNTMVDDGELLKHLKHLNENQHLELKLVEKIKIFVKDADDV